LTSLAGLPAFLIFSKLTLLSSFYWARSSSQRLTHASIEISTNISVYCVCRRLSPSYACFSHFSRLSSVSFPSLITLTALSYNFFPFYSVYILIISTSYNFISFFTCNLRPFIILFFFFLSSIYFKYRLLNSLLNLYSAIVGMANQHSSKWSSRGFRTSGCFMRQWQSLRWRSWTRV